MGLFDVLLSLGGAFLEDASKNANIRQKEMSKKINDYDKKVSQYGANGKNINSEQFKKAKESLEKMKQATGNKTIDQWDKEWKCIGSLATASLTPYNHCVGLYRHEVNGKTMYLGRAIELNNGGFRKRLSDYRRESDSARTHKSGQTIHANLNKITTYILVVGNTDEAVEITKKLEHLFIAKYGFPMWNVQLKSK